MVNNVARIVSGMVIINKDGKLLMGKRKNNYCADTWCTPGGHVELFETLKDATIREIFEETDLKFKPDDLNFLCFGEDINPKENKHYVGTTYIVFVDSANPKLMEPEKCAEWKWFGKSDFPKDEELAWPVLSAKDKIFQYLK